jgi:hypothetical protein
MAECGDDNCASTPCDHDSSCANTRDTEYTCTCSAGWESVNCRDDIDNCITQSGDLQGSQYGGASTNRLCQYLTSNCLADPGRFNVHRRLRRRTLP